MLVNLNAQDEQKEFFQCQRDLYGCSQEFYALCKKEGKKHCKKWNIEIEEHTQIRINPLFNKALIMATRRFKCCLCRRL